MSQPPASPAVRAPIVPVLRPGALRLWSNAADSSGTVLTTLLDGPQSQLTTSARGAIALALEQMGIGPGDEVLMPAYHCLAMRAPVEQRGARAVFYRSDQDLKIDLADLEAHLSPHSRCVITVHFFGFPQDHAGVRRLCDHAGLLLIEDCAHAFYGPGTVAEIGRHGDFAVGSLMKFFPVFDGGCLVSFRQTLPPVSLASRGALFQLKAAVNTLDLAATWGRSRLLKGIVSLIGRATAAAKGARPALAQQLSASAPSAAQGGLDFQPEWVHTRMSLISRLVLRFAHHRNNVRRRRAVYQRFAAELAGVRGGHPLWPALPPGVVPYVFPFLLDAPGDAFPALRAAGVPMYRWEDVAEESCTTARQYKTRLVQFPCHQSLKEQEVTDLIRAIRRVLEHCSDIQATSVP